MSTARRLRTYPAYKESGVEGLGEIPAHWDIRRLKYIAAVRPSGVDKLTTPGEPAVRLCNYTNVYGHERITAGMDFMAATASPAEIQRLALRRGDVVVTKDSETWEDIAVPAIVADDTPDLVCGYHLALIRPNASRVSGPYLHRAFQAGSVNYQFRVAACGVTRFALSTEALATAIFPVPPIDEQLTIAAFLDRETARIDLLVARKERLIELLQEIRTTLITRTVTKGLDPTVPMKDSGVEWLGEIPANWDVKRLWHLTPPRRRIMYGIVLPGPTVDDGVPIVKGGDVSPERLRLGCLNRTTREIEAGYVRSRLQGGDLVYAIRGSIGEVAMVPPELTGANLTQDAARVAYTPATHGPWLLYALKSKAVFAQLEVGALGATIRGINIGDLKRASVPVPKLSEQRAIAAFLDRETARLDTLIEKIRHAVGRLIELRAALISATVTGRIDVREEAP